MATEKKVNFTPWSVSQSVSQSVIHLFIYVNYESLVAAKLCAESRLLGLPNCVSLKGEGHSKMHIFFAITNAKFMLS